MVLRLPEPAPGPSTNPTDFQRHAPAVTTTGRGEAGAAVQFLTRAGVQYLLRDRRADNVTITGPQPIGRGVAFAPKFSFQPGELWSKFSF